MSLVEQFIEFIDRAPIQSARAVSERVLTKCRAVTGAEAGTIFILRRRGNRRWLEAMSSQNEVISTRGESFEVPVDVASIAGYVATTGQTVFIEDAYAIPADRPFRFNPSFDLLTGYRTHSILCFALESQPGRIVGVVQLINRRNGGPDGPEPFLPGHRAMIDPVNNIVGRAIERADNLEQIKRQNRALRERNRQLHQEKEQVRRLQQETERGFMLSINLLARAAELHDADTGEHIVRVNHYAGCLAGLARLPAAFRHEISYAAALHDVGKMSVDKAVLHKPGPLNPAERQEMERHTIYGYEILAATDRLHMAAAIARHHHEKWDGSGYPDRLKGEAIPIAARIVALGDVYDALRSARPYKAGLSHETTLAVMTRGDHRLDPASHFDPGLHRLFLRHHQEFAAIWNRFGEPPPTPDSPAG